jgi:small conductance mechanosensitive channel
LIYEGCNRTIEKHLNRRDADGKALQASARMRTLLPMIRNMVFVFFAVIVGFVTLSEAGFNIGPLLAGAGVVGVAVGFGSQALVKDFLTGLFIVIENTIAVGDVVKIGSHSGVVESISFRTLRLRDNEGALHILPFSIVTDIVNMTRDFAFAVINVGVSYSSDLEHVMRVIRAVGEDLQKDPVFKRVILEPIEILGVDSLGDSSITISSRLRTRPGKQWDVRRMFLLKLKQAFDKEKIEIPFPTVTSIQKPN